MFEPDVRMNSKHIQQCEGEETVTNRQFEIVEFDNLTHRSQVIELWQTVFGYEADHNSPETAIDKKIEMKDHLFFVAQQDGSILGTVMAGYDGHRGWIYSIAVHPAHRTNGVGSKLLTHVERKLIDLGCLKVNLQILEENSSVRRFYEANGFLVEKRVSMGKKLY